MLGDAYAGEGGAFNWSEFGDPWPRCRTQNKILRTSTDLLRLWRTDILAWCYDTLHELPREWQPAVLEACCELLNAHGDVSIAIVACRKAGKSRAAAVIALWFLTTRKDSLVIFIAPIWSQVVDSLWAEIRTLWLHSIWPKMFPKWRLGEVPRIKTGWPLWRCIGIASNRVQNLEGKHGQGGTCVIFDEGKAIDDDKRESVDGMLHSDDSESLLVTIGTPGPPIGFFYRAFADDRPFWADTFRIRSLDIPRLARRARMRRDRLGATNPWYLQQEEAIFAGADEFTVLPHILVQAAIERYIPRKDGHRRGMALDVAGRGADESVLTFGTGPTVERISSWQGWEREQTSQHTAQQIRAFEPDFFIVDKKGLGEAVRGRVSDLLADLTKRRVLKARSTRTRRTVKVIGYDSGAPAFDNEQYENRKAEDLFALRTRLEDEDASIPNNALLISQWCSYRWELSKRKRTKIIDPEDSPDYGDSGFMYYAGQSRRKELGKVRIPGI